MRLIYSKRAIADLDQIATYYTAHASPTIAESIGRQLLGVIARILGTSLAKLPDQEPSGFLISCYSEPKA
jgi:toxin ParE1/3/4